jgi:hypothetical protein
MWTISKSMAKKLTRAEANRMFRITQNTHSREFRIERLSVNGRRGRKAEWAFYSGNYGTIETAENMRQINIDSTLADQAAWVPVSLTRS